MKLSALVFDCDGTLVDSLGQALESFNFALEKVGERQRRPEEIKRYFGAAADRILVQVIGDEARGLEAFEYYMDHQTELARTMKLHAGIRKLLDHARAENVPMAVVTGRHERDLEIVVRPHAISEYFGTLIADSQLPQSKPAPDGILRACEHLGVDPGESAYVGDSVVDMEAARRAGAHGIAALWDPLANEDELRRAGATTLAKTPMDVWNYFKKQN